MGVFEYRRSFRQDIAWKPMNISGPEAFWQVEVSTDYNSITMSKGRSAVICNGEYSSRRTFGEAKKY